MPDGPVFTKSEYAYSEIKRRILADELAAGTVVNQEVLSAELSMSTTPVREALKRLSTEGLVRLDSYRNAQVTDLTESEARSLFEVRMSLDPLAVELAAQRRSDADIARISRTLQTLEPLTASVGVEAFAAHRDFHRTLYTASANAPLVEILEGLWDKADRYRQLGLRESAGSMDVERVRREHEALASAVIAGETERAAQVMREHIAHSLGRRALTALESGA
ncbi:GntR family transcriptional regulator [Knoellia sinensis KCTC 19936]|uniref:GntR family transcriptional regulator n=1 Tax=Knoellia sinensis KCTC 19936 TaxID=1385520 RepID=A0A0A0J702_9MICO|nr:GntR family transcriptional regulator [Knoellia sinensis]KGN31852.1 GntR family transcriptional regulator [Knoellia sinensis KCTC 19936]